MNFTSNIITHQNLQWLPCPMQLPSQTQWWSNWRTHLSQSWQCFARGGCIMVTKKIIDHQNLDVKLLEPESHCA